MCLLLVMVCMVALLEEHTRLKKGCYGNTFKFRGACRTVLLWHPKGVTIGVIRHPKGVLFGVNILPCGVHKH